MPLKLSHCLKCEALWELGELDNNGSCPSCCGLTPGETVESRSLAVVISEDLRDIYDSCQPPIKSLKRMDSLQEFIKTTLGAGISLIESESSHHGFALSNRIFSEEGVICAKFLVQPTFGGAKVHYYGSVSTETIRVDSNILSAIGRTIQQRLNETYNFTMRGHNS